jgi:hypothetical protein
MHTIISVLMLVKLNISRSLLDLNEKECKVFGEEVEEGR